jgi:hypothetical protein
MSPGGDLEPAADENAQDPPWVRKQAHPSGRQTRKTQKRDRYGGLGGQMSLGRNFGAAVETEDRRQEGPEEEIGRATQG